MTETDLRAGATINPSRRETAPPLIASDSVPEGDFDEPADPSAIGDPDLPGDRFGNREMSWLNFNARVLALAEDRRQPLLERMKFLAIFASNLDEFYMVRVAGLKRRADMGLSVRSSDGQSPSETLTQIAERTRELTSRQARCFGEDIQPALEAEGVRIVRWDSLEDSSRAALADYFRSKFSLS